MAPQNISAPPTICAPESHLVYRRVPIGQRALVLVDGKFRLSAEPQRAPIIYPATLLTQLRAVIWRVSHDLWCRAHDFLTRLCIGLWMHFDSMIIGLTVIGLAYSALNQIASQRAALSQSKVVAQIHQEQLAAAPTTPPVSKALPPLPSSSSLAIRDAQPSTTQVDSAAPPNSTAAPVVSTVATSPIEQTTTVAILRPTLFPAPPVPPPVHQMAFSAPPPLPEPSPSGHRRSGHRRSGQVAVEPLESKAKEVAKTIDVDTVELRPRASENKQDDKKDVSSPESRQLNEMTLAPSYRPVTTNAEALVIRLSDGKFKEIQPGQPLPSGETLISVDRGGASYKTSVGTFSFSTNGATP